VHRDIKPANVLISRDGEVKLADFGIALPAGISIHTQGPYTMGTYAYLSPEQLRGDQLDERCDIYAIGAVLYEMVSGERAFPEQTVAELVENKMKGVYCPVNKTVEECPPSLAQIIHRCLQADRENRYEGIGELKEDLETFLRGETASTPHEIVHNYLHRPNEPLTPSRVMQRISPPAKLRRFAPLFIPAAAVLIVLLVTVTSLWFRLRDHEPVVGAGPAPELSAAPEQSIVEKNAESEAAAPTSDPSDAAKPQKPRQELSEAKTPPAPPRNRSTENPPSPAAKPAEREGSPSKPEYLEAGNVAFGKGNWDEAEKQYRAALDAAETENRQELAAIRLLETYVLSIQTKDALEFIEQTSVHDGKYHLLAGKAYLQAEIYDAAEKSFARAQSVPTHHDGVLREATYLLGKTRDAIYLKSPSIENRLLALRVWENVLHNHCAGQKNKTPLCQEARNRIDKLTDS
jgi:tetratricopeptide (TPR) repeat protein